MSDRLLLVRHGLTDWNRDGRFQGQLDPHLSAVGRRQASLLAQRLAAAPTNRQARILSSPLARALETAEVVAEALALPRIAVMRDARLKEVGQGEWEGRTHAELARSDAERYAAWRTGPWDRQPPGGEPLIEASERMRAAVGAAIADADREAGWPLCIIGHGGSLRLAAGSLLDLELQAAWTLEMDNASLSILERVDEGWRLATWNDTGHLLGRVAQHAGEEDGTQLAL